MCKLYLSDGSTLHKKAAIHPVTTILATSKNVLFPGHNHLLITGAANPTLLPERQQVKGHHYWWLVSAYDPGSMTFLKVASMVVNWWIVAFLPSGRGQLKKCEMVYITVVYSVNSKTRSTI